VQDPGFALPLALSTRPLSTEGAKIYRFGLFVFYLVT